MPHNRTLVNAYHTYLVLPYYAEIPSQLKNKLNRAFLQDLKRKYGKIAYLHGLEKQHGHLHVNYYMLSDERLDIEFIREKWGKWLERHTKQKLKAADDVYAEPVNDHRNAAQYIVKYFRPEMPHEYLPERGRYWRTYYTSRNFTQFCDERSEDALLQNLLETMESDTPLQRLSHSGTQPVPEEITPMGQAEKKEHHGTRPRRTHSKVGTRLQARTRSTRRHRAIGDVPHVRQPTSNGRPRSSDAPRNEPATLNSSMDEQLDYEMRLYHNCYTMAKLFHLDDDTAANEAKCCLQLFVEQCKKTDDRNMVAATIYEQFEDYLKQW